MANESLMKVVNNVAPLYADKMGLYRKWIREGERWNEKRARKEARALAAHFGEAIETMPREGLRRLRYGAKDFDEAADFMIEEFKDDERPKWSIGESWPKPEMGATPAREEMKPLITLLDELAAVQPEARFAILELGLDVPGWHPGNIILSVEDLARYFRLAINDSRLGPRARIRLIGPNFYWERDDAGIGTVMVYDPKLRISMPFMREET